MLKADGYINVDAKSDGYPHFTLKDARVIFDPDDVVIYITVERADIGETIDAYGYGVDELIDDAIVAIVHFSTKAVEQGLAEQAYVFGDSYLTREVTDGIRDLLGM